MAKKKTSKERDINQDESIENGAEPRVYELGFHLDPELPIEEVKRAYTAIRELISDKCPIVAESEPQKIQLAYTISRQETAGRRDFNSAHFAWIVYETSAENHAEILSGMSSNKKIIRFIDLLTTKDTARHSVEMREISLKASERAETNDDQILEAELDSALEKAVI